MCLCWVLDDRDCRKGFIVGYLDGLKRDIEERLEWVVIKNVDVDDFDVEVLSDSDERYVEF